MDMTPTPVLLVDDIDANLISLSGVLRAPEVSLLTARSGTEALEILLVQEVAVALIDVQMPSMDGFELAELMRGNTRTRQIPIIFLTAGDRGQEWVFRGYESGAVDFLYKPIDTRLLQSKVSVFVKLYEQRQQLAQQVIKMQEMLAVSDRFISVLGHDLRNPASAISMGLELLISQEKDPQKVELLKRVNRTNMRMSRLVAQMLDFARARLGGTIPIKPVPLDMGEVARAAIKENSALSTQVRLETQGNLSATLDPDRLAQAMSNLLGNAVTYGPKGSLITVRLSGSRAGQLDIAVHNHGQIPEKIMERLFTPGPYGQKSSSLGLGLYIVDQIVRAHGGTISCKSSAAQGTTFYIELPRTGSGLS
jgi:signal transduction histidine kinase